MKQPGKQRTGIIFISNGLRALLSAPLILSVLHTPPELQQIPHGIYKHAFLTRPAHPNLKTCKLAGLDEFAKALPEPGSDWLLADTPLSAGN